jgi:hypothetical protein
MLRYNRWVKAVHTATNRSKDSNGYEHEISTAEGGDLHMVQPEPTSGRELTNRTQNMIEDRIRPETEDKQKSEEVFGLCGVVTVTFRVLSWFVVTV